MSSLRFSRSKRCRLRLVGSEAIEAGGLEIENLAGLAGLQRVVAGRLRRQRDDALREAVEIDDDLHRLRAVFLSALAFSSAGLSLDFVSGFIADSSAVFAASSSLSFAIGETTPFGRTAR